MTRVLVSPIVKACIVAVLFVAAPASADPVTLNFTGTVDLTSEGGSPSVFNGSITWESSASPFESEPGFATYDPLTYTLFFNGADVSEPVIGDGTGSGISIGDDFDFFQTGTPGDFLGFFLEFDLPFNLSSTGENELILLGFLGGPTTMFNSTALPPNLNFLNQLTTTLSLYLVDPDEGDVRSLNLQGTLEPSIVAEPTTLALMGLGAVGLLARARRPRRSSNA